VKKLDEKFYTSLSLSLSLSIYIYIYIGKSIDQKNYISEFSFCSWPSQQHIIGTAMCGFQTQNMQTDKPEGDGRH
jgi:predicted nucleic acid-binding Zn finger protein